MTVMRVVKKLIGVMAMLTVRISKTQTVSLQQFKGKYVVLFFWPLDFSFVCPTEICQFSDNSPAFDALNCQVLGCSVDSPFTHMAYTRKPRKEGGLGEMKIPMLSDTTHNIAKHYGALIEDGNDAGQARRSCRKASGSSFPLVHPMIPWLVVRTRTP